MSRSMSLELRFIVDTMLGSLARWLRILGYDSLYDRNYDDWRIIRIASEDRRIIITKDRGLYITARKKGLDAILIEDENIAEALKNLRRRYGIKLEIDPKNTRCPICNNLLRRTSSVIDIAGRVPESVAKNYKEFWICDKCGRVYWRGRHWRSIEKILSQARS
ncbi:MAG: Mut7-C RNAse domain-containing protein [Sulfolobales archaeon]